MQPISGNGGIEEDHFSSTIANTYDLFFYINNPVNVCA